MRNAVKGRSAGVIAFPFPCRLADQKDPLAVRPANGGAAIDDHDAPGLDGDPGESDRDDRVHRLHADRRHVDANVLLGLGAFGKHTGAAFPPYPPGGAQRADPFEHRGGTLGGLEADDPAVYRDRGLSGIDRADRAGGADGAL